MDPIVGKTPVTTPPRVAEFDDLDKRHVEVVVDTLKYLATSSGVAIAFYTVVLERYLAGASSLSPTARLLVFSPVICFFLAVVASVLAIFPRTYRATNDAAKEEAVKTLRHTKGNWLRAVLVLFLLGVGCFVYQIGAQIWGWYPNQ